MEVDRRSNKSPPENIKEIRTPPPKVQHENPWPDLRTMAESPGAGAPRSAPTTEVLCPENLQYVQVEDIQALIMILQYLIPPRGDPTQAKNQPSVTQEDEIPTPPTPRNAAIKE